MQTPSTHQRGRQAEAAYSSTLLYDGLTAALVPYLNVAYGISWRFGFGLICLSVVIDIKLVGYVFCCNNTLCRREIGDIHKCCDMSAT